LVILLLILLVGAVMADDKGWMDSGLSSKLNSLNLSSFWGGLSANPTSASVQLESAMKLQTNTAFTGKLIGYGKGNAGTNPLTIGASPTPISATSPSASGLIVSSPSPSASTETGVLPSSASAPPLASSTSSAGSLISTTSSDSSANATLADPLSSSYNFVFVGSGQNFDLSYSSNSSTNVVGSGGYRVVGGVVYTKVIEDKVLSSSATTSSTAASTELESWKKSGTLSMSPDLITSLIAKKLAAGQFVSGEKVGAERTYHFKSTISGSDIPLFSLVLPKDTATLWQASNGSMDIWVSRLTHQLVKVSFDLVRANDKNKITFEAVYDSAQVKSEIKIPENVVDTKVLPKTPDEQRKADLLAVAAALEKYKADNGGYPIATVRERIDQATSVLQLKLLPEYLTKIPADSVISKYYDYSSDGSTYELSAVLDSSTDTEGVMVGNKMIYTVKGPIATTAATGSSASSPSHTPSQ